MTLSGEDKQWISGQLERATSQYAQQLELATSQYAQQLERATSQYAQQLEQSEERMAARYAQQLEQSEERMAARVERVETALLTEFHKWASPLEMRIRTHSAALRAIDLELEAVGERVTKLEGQQ